MGTSFVSSSTQNVCLALWNDTGFFIFASLHHFFTTLFVNWFDSSLNTYSPLRFRLRNIDSASAHSGNRSWVSVFCW